MDIRDLPKQLQEYLFPHASEFFNTFIKWTLYVLSVICLSDIYDVLRGHNKLQCPVCNAILEEGKKEPE